MNLETDDNSQIFFVVHHQQMTNIICNYSLYEVLNAAGFVI